jgi:hypothetical protein
MVKFMVVAVVADLTALVEIQVVLTALALIFKLALVAVDLMLTAEM